MKEEYTVKTQSDCLDFPCSQVTSTQAERKQAAAQVRGQLGALPQSVSGAARSVELGMIRISCRNQFSYIHIAKAQEPIKPII